MSSVIDLRKKVPLSMVYGGGGAVGIAWHLAVIEAMTQFGFNVADAPSVGTSAGSWACGAARLKIGYEAFHQVGEIPVPNRRPGALREIVADIIGEVTVPGAQIAVVDRRTTRRVILNSEDHPLPDLVAASSAVPGVFAPHTIAGRTYVDGGVRSMASIDVARPAELLIASLPIAGPLFGPVGRTFELTSRHALARWRERTGGQTIVLRPGRTFVNAIGRNPQALLNSELAKHVYPIAFDTVIRRLNRRLRDVGHLDAPAEPSRLASSMD